MLLSRLARGSAHQPALTPLLMATAPLVGARSEPEPRGRGQSLGKLPGEAGASRLHLPRTRQGLARGCLYSCPEGKCHRRGSQGITARHQLPPAPAPRPPAPAGCARHPCPPPRQELSVSLFIEDVYTRQQPGKVRLEWCRLRGGVFIIPFSDCLLRPFSTAA